MDYEKAYKEALERAKGLIDFCSDSELKTLENVFPELRESEDERIRKELFNYLYDVHDDDEERARWIAWLEKQGEHAKFRESIQIGDEVTRNKDGMLVNLSQLKRVAKPNESKQGEQKAMYHDICDKCVRQPTCQSDCFLQQDEQKPAEWTEEDEEQLEFCCAAIEMSDFSNVDYRTQAVTWLNLLKDRVHPQPKQEWSEEDEIYKRRTIEVLEKLRCHHLYDYDITDSINWLKSLKERYTWSPSDEQMKALWEVYKGGEEQAALASLYSDLKKLKD